MNSGIQTLETECFKMRFINVIMFHDLLSTNMSVLVIPMFIHLLFVASGHGRTTRDMGGHAQA